MGIEYRGENKYRFRVQKDKIIYKDNYYCSKKISEKAGIMQANRQTYKYNRIKQGQGDVAV